MSTGSVKWFDNKKGYGFIRPDDGTKDVFVNSKAVSSAGLEHLCDQQRLSYETQRGQDGNLYAGTLQAL